MQILEQRLSQSKYLAADYVTLADLFGCGMISPAFQMFFDGKWRAEHPRVTDWVQDIYQQPIYQAVCPGELRMCEKAIPNKPVQDPSSYAR